MGQNEIAEPLWFDEMEVGDKWQSPARTVTETDVVNFAGMTGDFDPLHVDHEFARNSPFGKPVAHGLLGLSLVAGLGSNHPRAATVAFMGIRDWQFLKPIFFGDTVLVVNEIIELEPQGKRRGKVVWQRSLFNQSGELVQQGLFDTLVSVRRKKPSS